MSVLITLLDAGLAFGALPLLDGAALTVADGDRVGLIGRNGTGKSTLLGVLAGRVALDDGRVVRRDGLAVTLVEQEPQLPPAETVLDALLVRAGLTEPASGDERSYWRRQARITEFLDRLGVDAAAAPDRLSGGQRKRAALALAFGLEPELLLLDEPTNHLDIAAIEQLEGLIGAGPALVVITHDRRFLDNVVNRIVELDRGLLRSFPGRFSDYEASRGEQLAAERVANRKFDRFWAQEEAWIRKGIEARRTRNEGRVRRLEALRRDRATRRERSGKVRLELDAGERSGRLVCELTGVGVDRGGRTLIDALDLTVMRGDRLGLIGPNGAGKSTLLELITGDRTPDRGTIRFGTRLEVAYFDQMREQLDGERSVAETVSPGSDYVEINGARRHVMSYLGDFLFPPNRAGSPVRTLSGGERNRLLLARLFARPANLLILDEPTNDLDLESIELLEETLQSYPGTLLLVSHDRAFLDNIVTSVLVAQGEGAWLELVGGYREWQAVRAQREAEPRDGRADRSADRSAAGDSAAAAEAGPQSRRPARRSGLGYQEKRELAELPAQIEALERTQQQLQRAIADPALYRGPGEAIRARQEELADVERRLDAAMARWAVLVEKDESGG
ncbi:MAG: ATP-binding cassette domain-containing protein [Lautropia sp.]